MKRSHAKVAAAMIVVIAGIAGVTRLIGPRISGWSTPWTLTGPVTRTFSDGSVVGLQHDAKIRTYGDPGKRGFEHLSGVVNVTVPNAKGRFIVTTAYGDVRAFGAEFTLDLVDGVTANTPERVELLGVEVTEGSVEVGNDQGASVLSEQQGLVVEKNRAPYRLADDGKIPARLKERINTMVAAMRAADSAAYVANYNLDYLYRLAKGQAEYDANLFGGTEADVQRLQRNMGAIAGVEALAEAFKQGINFVGATNVYLRNVEVSADGKHAKARLVTRLVNGMLLGGSPQWHYFDNDWWQIDD